MCDIYQTQVGLEKLFMITILFRLFKNELLLVVADKIHSKKKTCLIFKIKSLFFFSQFCTAALEHSASEVREPAVRIILSMYQQHRAAVLSYLSPSNSATRWDFLYKSLFDGFAKIDGKLVEFQAGLFFFFFFFCHCKLISCLYLTSSSH